MPISPGEQETIMKDASAAPDSPLPFEALLPCLRRVQGPGQYAGGEPNAVSRDPRAVRLRVALAYPDLYAVGMSHHGTRVLYALANAIAEVQCDRVFAPAPDLEAELRARRLPLTTLETRTPLKELDALGVSLSYELGATALLTILDLGGIPLRRTDRNASAPIVIAGGHAAFNPEPFADFVDVFLVGEADASFPECLGILLESKGRTNVRLDTLRRIAREVPGAYVPAFYETHTASSGAVRVTNALEGAPLPVRRRIVHDFASLPEVTDPVVPVFETVHERVTLEVMRGCPNGCRFCQAGMIGRPVRARPVEALLRDARAALASTGYDEIGLLSLSTSDYPDFDRLLEEMDRAFAPDGVSLSLPSLRVDDMLKGIPARLGSVRRSGFTIAPEAGTDRLRAAVNKHVTNEDLLEAATAAYEQGWRAVKLYFMCGLPTETEEDVRAIGELATRVGATRKKRGGPPPVTVSLANFVPKPHTPFQWEAMASRRALSEKHRIVSDALDRRRVTLNTHDIRVSLLEGALSRGDRRLGRVIETAYRAGARLDAWAEHFRFDLWESAFREAGLDLDALASAERDPDAALPWSHIDTGLGEAFLREERARSRNGIRTPPCAPGQCAGCGVAGCAFRETPRTCAEG